MRDELKKLKNRLKKEEQDKEGKESDEAKSTDSDVESEDTEDTLDTERKSILEQGKSYVKPLSLNPKKAMKISGIIVGGLLIVILSVFAVLIYRFESDNDIVYGASKVIPFPAARVNSSFVGYDDYLFELKTLKSSSASQLNEGEDVDFTTEEGQEQLDTLKTLAMAEAQRKLIVSQFADENEISISEESLDEEIDHFIEQEGGEEQLEQAIDDFFGWTLNDFREVIRIQMLEQELAEARAEEVMEEVQGDNDFAELAREYSSDGSASEGGDLGFVDEDTSFVDEFKDAALDLEPGEISDIVETEFGYHIIKATDEDDDGRLRVSHILIDRSSIQQEIQNKLKDATVSSYINVEADAVNEQPDAEPEAEESDEESDSEESDGEG